jgi:hypothetical protein
VDLHGGSIALDSQLGQGSRFTIRIPIWPNKALLWSRGSTGDKPPSRSHQINGQN